MRINKINLQNLNTNFKNNINKFHPCFGRDKTGKDSFESKDTKKTNHAEKNLLLFPALFKKELTPEEEKSKDINHFLGELRTLNKSLKKQGKFYREAAINLIAIGMNTNYRPYDNIDGKNKEKVVFKKINNETDLPEAAVIVKIEDNTPVMEYDFYGGSVVNIKDYKNPNRDVLMTMAGKNIIYYEERNKNTNITKQLTPLKNGFYYFEGIADENENFRKTDTCIEAEYYYFNSKKNYYIEKNNEGKLIKYKYDNEKCIWKPE